MVLTWYAMRWSIEVAFQSSKTHLGFEEPQGWTRRAVERTAPTAMLLYSLIVLWFAGSGHRHDHPPNRPWYTTKRHASFADMLTTLKRRQHQGAGFVNPSPWPGFTKANANATTRRPTSGISAKLELSRFPI